MEAKREPKCTPRGSQNEVKKEKKNEVKLREVEGRKRRVEDGRGGVGCLLGGVGREGMCVHGGEVFWVEGGSLGGWGVGSGVGRRETGDGREVEGSIPLDGGLPGNCQLVS